MSDNRKYYYLKLKENFYNSETMVILESMQDGLLYSNLLLKMYLMSLKSGGILMLNDHLPHTPQTIATFTRHQVGTVERALKVFLEFGLVEILTDGAYYMTDIQLLIGQSSTEGERKKKERMRLKRQKLLPSGGADICPPYSQGDICPPEIRDKRLDIRDKSIEWWTAEEYEAWMNEQKNEMEALIGTGDGWYDGQGVFHEFTQESVDAMMDSYKETLESIKKGVLYSKDDGDGDTYSMIPPTEDVVSSYSVDVTKDNGKTVHIGDYSTVEELDKAISDAVKNGQLTQEEADSVQK